MTRKRQDVLFTKKDGMAFRKWLNLNMDGITWQGRFKKEFEFFWDTFFPETILLKELFERIDYVCSQVNIGSLTSWFIWFRNKFFNYIYIFNDISIEELANDAKISPAKLSTILRNFFLEEYPHLDPYFSEVFSVGSVLSPHLKLRFEEIKNQMKIEPPEVGSRSDEIMISMEITLFDEWAPFLRKMNTDFRSRQFSMGHIRERSIFLRELRVVEQIFILGLFFFFITVALKKVNSRYERYLLNKVSIYEPQMRFLNKNLVFKQVDNRAIKEFKLNFNQIKDITKGESITEFFDPLKYEEETETVLTSAGNLPKDFLEADKESSQYEGDSENPNGYRETKDGTTKIYRLMMTSTNTYSTKDKIASILKKYGGEPVGDSTPGMNVPGGLYFNIYVPKKDFKSFVTETMQVADSKLLENNTSNVKNVPGKTRIFIMVKSI